MYRFVSDHWEVIGGAIAYCALAAVATMPPKGTPITKQVLYDWLYDFSHMLVNQRGQKRNLPLDPRTAE